MSKHLWRSTLSRNLLRRLALCLVLIGFLAACSQETPAEPRTEMVSFRSDMNLGKEILAVRREDTDSDGADEWLVFYRFDQVGTGGPVAAIIYDAAVDTALQLPVLYPFKLRIPDQSYLATEVPGVTLVNILTEGSGKALNELVFSTEHELAIFRLSRDPAMPPTDNPPLYRCVGFFRSDRVSFDPVSFQVVVTSFAGFERSQLVTKRYYKPDNSASADGYFVAGTTALLSPYDYEVDFREPVNEKILDTPFPEKILLAFYQSLGQADAKPPAADYLSTQAAGEFRAGRLRFGSPFGQEQIKRATVKRISYFPTQESDTTARVIAEVVFTSRAGQQSNPIEVTWDLQRVENHWKLHALE